MTNANCGRIILSFDLDSPAGSSAIAAARQQASSTRQLLDLLNRHRVAATWGVFNPSRSAIAQMIMDGPVEHEIALVGDSSWVGTSAGRARFACELSRRLDRARAAGVPIETLMLRDVQLTDNFDLLAKHGLSVVQAVDKVKVNSVRSNQPKPLRFGVWQATAHIQIAGATGWLPGFSHRSKIRRAIRQAISASAVVHLALSGAELAANSSRVMTLVEQTLQLVQQQRDEESLHVETLSGMANRLGGVRKTARSRSILRKVA